MEKYHEALQQVSMILANDTLRQYQEAGENGAYSIALQFKARNEAIAHALLIWDDYLLWLKRHAEIYGLIVEDSQVKMGQK